MAQAISKADLFSRLAEGHAARTTVVTPNRRLSQGLMAEFDAHQAARGLAAWEAPDILPLEAFMVRLWEDAFYSERDLPLLLTSAQEQAIWEEILAGSELLSIPPTATQFRDWARKYEAHTRGEIDSARLPDWILGLQKEGAKTSSPNLLVAYAFDIVPPQTNELLAAFTLAHCAPQRAAGSAIKLSFRSARQELERAAAWARARLEEGRSRIGVVVPELARRRKEVARVFSRVMQPGCNLPGMPKSAMPFNVSLGEPLAEAPPVHFALSLIRLSFQEIDFAEGSRIVRSPFLGGAETEMTRRARLDRDLREKLSASVSLAKLVASVGPCPLLRQRLERVFQLRTESKSTYAGWARHFSALLEAAGFPGERTSDSDEFQALAKWHETLAELAKLERIAKPVPIQQAFASLAHLCADTLFQPATEAAAAPIQILGVLESAGVRFARL